MVAKSFAVASLLALAATVSAEPEKPRIYFPRSVRRSYGNGTVTSTFNPSQSQDSETHSSTKRDGPGNPLGSIISGLLGGGHHSSSSPASVTTVVVSSFVYESPTPTDSGIVVGPTGVVSHHSTDKKKPEHTTTTDTGLLGGVGGGLSTLVSDILPGASSTAANHNGTAKATGTDHTSATSEPTSTETGLLPTLSIPLLSSLTPESTPTSTPSQTGGSGSGNGTSTITTNTGLLPTLTLPSLTQPSGTATSTDNSTQPTGTSTGHASGHSTGPTHTTTGVVPVGNATSTDTGVTGPTSLSTTGTGLTTATGTPSGKLPTTTGASGVIGNSTATATGKNSASTPLTPSSALTPLTTTPLKPTIVPAAKTTSAPSAVTSIGASGSLTNSNAWLPTTIVIEQTTNSFTPVTGPNTATSTALPTDIPSVIMPNHPSEVAPEGTVPIQIGFKYALNWDFVFQQTTAASQIFAFLPQALAEAGNIPLNKIQVNSLVPYNTQAEWGYITTIAKLDYPADMVKTLQAQIYSPNAALYNLEQETLRNLTNVINPKIPIDGDDDSGDSGKDSGGGDDGNSSSGSFNSNSSGDQSSKQKGVTAGIALGAVSLSAMYGAAMFIVARRYKRKKQAHRRANSVTSSQASSEMGYTAGSPPLMGGALLSRDMSSYGGVAGGPGGRNSHGSGQSAGHNSARTANISAPMAAENSLGWN